MPRGQESSQRCVSTTHSTDGIAHLDAACGASFAGNDYHDGNKTATWKIGLGHLNPLGQHVRLAIPTSNKSVSEKRLADTVMCCFDAAPPACLRALYLCESDCVSVYKIIM